MKLSTILLIGVCIFMFSCRMSEEERERQRRIEDSLMEIERNRALDNADVLLQKMDSMMQDTVTETALQE